MRSALPVLLSLFVLACDEPSPAPAPPPATAPAGRERVEMGVVTVLAPQRETHLARGADGTIWWVQESDDGRDVAFALGSDGVPRATGLTSARVLAALNLPAADSPTAGAGANARGNIQSIAGARDGRVWFYFAGGAGRASAACVGAFDPRDESIRIAVPPPQLTEATAMGASLVLARGTLVPAAAGDALWLWVRHSDASAVFRIDAKSNALSRPFDAVTTPAGQPLAMTRPGQAIGPASNGLLLLDPAAVELWHIDPAGRATSVHPLVGLPQSLSTPIGDARGRALVFAADAPLIPARSEAEAGKLVLAARYPAMLIFENQTLRALDRDDLQPAEGVALEEMQLRQLLPDGDAGALLGYDAASGALVRLRHMGAPQ